MYDWKATLASQLKGYLEDLCRLHAVRDVNEEKVEAEVIANSTEITTSHGTFVTHMRNK